ncbi:18160_t:CDS:2, partial [Racocetra persica]
LMVEIVESKEILINLINLIWKATSGKVVTVTFNNQLRLATILLDNRTNATVNLERIADNKNIPKYQLYNKSVSDNLEHEQDMDKLINVVSEMFNQSKNSIQADDVDNVCQLNNERVNINNQDDERNDEKCRCLDTPVDSFIQRKKPKSIEASDSLNLASEGSDSTSEASDLASEASDFLYTISEVNSLPINRYFNKALISSLKPELLPMLMEDVNSCTSYLRIWDFYYNHCIREIGNQDYKMLKLICLLSEVFFNMLKICHQEQDNEKALEKNTGYWKGRDIKSRMNKL